MGSPLFLHVASQLLLPFNPTVAAPLAAFPADVPAGLFWIVGLILVVRQTSIDG